MYREIVRSCPETWLLSVQNFSSFAFTKPQLLDFASVGANRGKKKRKKQKKTVSMFRRFNISLVFRAARSKRSAKPIISTYCPSRKIRFQGLSKSWSKKKKTGLEKFRPRFSFLPRGEVESRKETKVNGERERENRKGMILDTTTRQIFATSSRASIIPRPSTRYQRSLIDLSPRKKREREEHRWWNFWNQLPGSEMAR